MKRPRYILNIEKPCEHDWGSMANNNTGKFCFHCSKSVVDFTKLTDNEVISIIEQTSGKLCGRLTSQQINRLLETKGQTSKLNIFKIFAGLLLIGQTETSFANNNQTKIEITQNNGDASTFRQEKESIAGDSLKNVVQGKVIDIDTKEPNIGVYVSIKDSKIFAQTNTAGDFKLIIPDSLLTDRIIIKVFYVGYKNFEVTINKKDLPLTNQLYMIKENLIDIVGEIIFYNYSKKRWWQMKK